jgi:hypothetical protein
MTECLPDFPRYIRQRDNEWQGADHQGGPWRPIPAPQSAPPWKTDGPAVSASLSPAAQAIWDAFNDAYEVQGPLEDMGQPLGAALRAAVDRTVPEPPNCGTPANDYVRGLEDRQRMARFRLLSIADELDPPNA